MRSVATRGLLCLIECIEHIFDRLSISSSVIPSVCFIFSILQTNSEAKPFLCRVVILLSLQIRNEFGVFGGWAQVFADVRHYCAQRKATISTFPLNGQQSQQS